MSARYRVLINPKSRTGDSLRVSDVAHRVFAAHDAEILVPDSQADLKRLARTAAADGFTHLVVAGGDGTINAILDEIVGTGIVLGVIPCGTANDLARQLGLPTDPETACRLVLGDMARDVDLIAVNGRHYVTGGAIGVATEIAAGVNRWKGAGGWRRWLMRALGSWAYLAYSAFYLPLAPKLWLDVHLDGDAGPQGPLRLLVMMIHNQEAIGKTFKATPFARIDDGLIEVCLLSWQGRWPGIYLVTLLAMGGRHVGKRGATIWRTRRLEISAAEPIVFMGDGEALARETHLVVEAVPGALRIVAPVDQRRTRRLTASLGRTVLLGSLPVAKTLDGEQPSLDRPDA